MESKDREEAKLNGLDLFSGIAGNTLGLREYINTVAYCEQDKHAQAVLLSRMSEGGLTPAPIWDDISTLKGAMFDIPIDIIIGGFPCQDISVAGRGKGLEGERSGLFFEVCRLVKEINPRFVFLENVPAIRTRGLREVIREFTDLGYGCRWTCVSAAEVGANHIRKRWFLLAYSRSERRQQDSRSASPHEGEYEGWSKIQNNELECGSQSCIWTCCDGSLHRKDNGLPYRLERLKRLGNAVVPIQAKEAFERLIGLKG